MVSARWHVEDLPSGVRRLTLDNPDKSHALNDSLLEQLEAVIREKKVRAFLLQSTGQRAFCSGFDLTQLSSIRTDAPLPDERMGEVFELLATHPAPSVALVQGAAFGAGCELAASCDFRVGGPQARFCMPPARLGVVYSADGISRVARHVGMGYARWMFLTGKESNAAEAMRAGLLNELHESYEMALEAALALSNHLAGMAPLAIAGMKKTFSLMTEPRFPAEDSAELELLRRTAFNSEDMKEGRQAFLQKRSAVFRGQ